jgi:hypothetical protein
MAVGSGLARIQIAVQCGLVVQCQRARDRLLESAVLSCVLKLVRDSPVGGVSCETRGIMKVLYKDSSPRYCFRVLRELWIELNCS